MKTSHHTRRGGILSTLLFIFLAIIALLVVGGLYVARNVHVETREHNGGDDVAIETPAGRINIRAHENLDPATLGLPLYPGAKRTKDTGGATFEWTSADGKTDKGLAVSGGSLLTPDPPSKVLAWYRAQLPNWVIVTERDGSTRFEFKEGGQKRIVAIQEKNDGTHIGVATVGDPASN